MSSQLLCPGAGRAWALGSGTPICPVCHAGPRTMGVRHPARTRTQGGGWGGLVPPHADQRQRQRPGTTRDEHDRWAAALTEDWLPTIAAGLAEKGPAVTVIDVGELHRRYRLVANLLAAARRAERDLETLEGQLVYADFEAKPTAVDISGEQQQA